MLPQAKQGKVAASFGIPSCVQLRVRARLTQKLSGAPQQYYGPFIYGASAQTHVRRQNGHLHFVDYPQRTRENAFPSRVSVICRPSCESTKRSNFRPSSRPLGCDSQPISIWISSAPLYLTETTFPVPPASRI